MFMKTMGKLNQRKRGKQKRKIDWWVRRKLNSIGKIIFKELVDSDICHEKFNAAINEEQSYIWEKKVSEQKTIN